MIDLSHSDHQVQCVSSFQELVSTPFQGKVNALCWTRTLIGDFSEIVKSIEMDESILEVDEELLAALELSEQGNLARTILLQDLQALKAQGASPVLNLIKQYERDDFFFPTDVYSFHVDRSPIPTNTFLCTYHGAASELIPNAQAVQKIQVPEIRAQLKELYDGPEDDFESFLEEHFFDLHYQMNNNAQPTILGVGHIWRLAVDYPESKVLPCVHRAPEETDGKTRLLLIC